MHFFKNDISAQKWTTIALTFRPFLATYIIFEKVNGQKRAKSNAIALTFRPFLAIYIIFEKVGKNEQKVRL